MPKRFKLETGHIVTVDDCDAYLLRATVFKAHVTHNAIRVVTGGNNDIDNHLSRRIMGRAEVIVHINGDSLDFTRSNMRSMTLVEYRQMAGSKMGCVNRGLPLSRLSHAA